MAKVLGYIIAGIGIVVMLLSFKLSLVPFLASDSALYVSFAGVIIIIIGVAISIWDTSYSSSKVKQAAEEVPIYEGTGKNRKIVGYRRAGK